MKPWQKPPPPQTDEPEPRSGLWRSCPYELRVRIICAGVLLVWFVFAPTFGQDPVAGPAGARGIWSALQAYVIGGEIVGMILAQVAGVPRFSIVIWAFSEGLNRSPVFRWVVLGALFLAFVSVGIEFFTGDTGPFAR